MKVYRVEHYRTRIGPYRHWGRLRLKIDKAHGYGERDRDTHPTPSEELGDAFWKWRGSKLYKDKPFKCGFSSTPQLKLWFKGWLKKLHNNGFVIRVYEAEDYLKGEKQVVFNHYRKRPVKGFSLLARKFVV